MALLQLQTLGGYAVRGEGAPFDNFATDKVRALLAYLALEPDQPHRRSHLATLLWADWDERSALSNLRKSLFRLRQALDEIVPGAAEELLDSARHTIQLKSTLVEVDALQFQAWLRESEQHQHADPYRCTTCRERLVAAAGLYRGDLLQGLLLSGAQPFEEWLTVQQEWLHRQAMSLLEGLADAFQADGSYDAAIDFASRQLALEPWRESTHRQLMLLYATTGQQALAIRQYEKCRLVLAEELGVLPAAETEQLLAAIREDRVSLELASPPPPMPLHHFPAQVTTFLGREQNVDSLLARLTDPEVRLVTLVGFGGSGKSTLAIKAAVRLAEEGQSFADGAWFVPLQAVNNHDILVTTLGNQFGLTFAPSKSPDQQIIDFLGNQQILLVLDNYEQLLPETGFVERLLQETPNVTLLITSRVPLDLRAEWRMPVDGLSVPSEHSSASEVQMNESARLLESIAQQIDPEFRITPANAPAIAHICRRLDGMPLALEIAGNWLRIHTPEELANQIESSLDFLVASRRDTPERHRSLQAVFDHSWDLLSSAQQTALARLSCFEGNFSLAAARAVTDTTVQELTTLLDHALIRRHVTGRYSLHPVLREFAQARLTGTAALFDEHSRWHLRRLAEISDRFNTYEAASATEQVDQELEDVRRAWSWAVKNERTERLNDSLNGLAAYYQAKGLFAEARDIFSEAASTLSVADNTSAQSLANRLHLTEATFRLKLGESERAIALADEVQRTAAEPTRTAALLFLGQAHNFQGNYDEAVAYLEEAMSHLEAQGDRAGLARGWYQIGSIHRFRNDYVRSIAAYKQSLALDRQLHNELGQSETHAGLGLVYKHTGDYQAAISHLQQARSIAESMNHRENIARFSQNLGLVYWQMEDLDQALTHYRQALKTAEEIQHYRGMAVCLGSIGVLHRRRHEYQAALDYYERALALSTQIGDQADRAIQFGNIGNIYMDLGQFEQAIAYQQQALAIDRQLGITEGVGRHLGNIGDCLKDQGRFAEARPYFEEAIPLLREVGARYYLCWQLISLAEVLLGLGEFDQVAALAGEGETIARQIDRRPYHFLASLVKVQLEQQNGTSGNAMALLDELALTYDLPEEQAGIAYLKWELSDDPVRREEAIRLNADLFATTGAFRFDQRLKALQRTADGD